MLQAHLSSKVATLVEEVFRRAGYGVLKNTSFTVETVLVFVYQLLNNTVAQQTRYVIKFVGSWPGDSGSG